MIIKTKRMLLKEVKEKLAGCTCRTCKFFYPCESSIRKMLNLFLDGGACSIKHRNPFDFHIAQETASDRADNYCYKYKRG